MTPSARVAAAIEILEDIARANAPADAILRDWSRRNRFAGSKDRRAIRELVYRDLRAGARYRWLASELGAEPDAPRTRMILACELEGAGTALSRFDGSGYGPAKLDEAEAGMLPRLSDAAKGEEPGWARAACPEALYRVFELQWGEEAAVDELAALNERAPVDLRVNTLRATRDEARAALAAAGYETEFLAHAPAGLRGGENARLTDLPPFRDGMVDPQDESSQLVARLCDAQPGMTVIDLCAGAGGKALALAEAMENSGDIVACDISASRLSRSEPRLARLGAQIVRLVPVPDGTPPADLAGQADRVLVDAPCSGGGTWRRSPELRWRTTAADISAYAKTQTEILDNAAGLVRPGGRLVYAVCSLFDEEGRDRAAAFEAAHPDFRRVPVPDVLGPELAGALGAQEDMFLTPHRHGTDGMFAAVFEWAG